jgi:hypothetical protein
LTIPVEEIPNSDTVHRWIFAPKMWDTYQKQMIWEGIWEFQRSRNSCESVVWDKYMPTSQHTHKLGIAQELRKREEKPDRDIRYIGFISANVGEIRSFRTARGHGFSVTHEPEEGDYHAHLCYLPALEIEFHKNDRIELKLKLKDLFREKSFQSFSAGTSEI